MATRSGLWAERRNQIMGHDDVVVGGRVGHDLGIRSIHASYLRPVNRDEPGRIQALFQLRRQVHVDGSFTRRPG